MKYLSATTAVLLTATSAQASVLISSKPTTNMNCANGVCSPTAKKAILNATDLANMLAGGDVAVASGSPARDIEVTAAFSWTSPNRLTLDAFQSITVKKPVTAAGPGGLAMVTNDGGTGGTLLFSGKGRAAFWDSASSLSINGHIFALITDIKTLAGDIAANPLKSYALRDNYNAKHDGIYASSPISTTFVGTFEGLGNTISNLQIVDHANDTNVGLFAESGRGSTLRDIRIAHAIVTAAGASMFVGGLVGTNRGGMINDAFVDATVSAQHSLESGVLAGGNFNGTITNSASTGSIDGVNGVGGLVGENYDGTISRSQSAANVSSPFADLGGLVGSAYSDRSDVIDYCHASGTVATTGSTNAGGLVGYNGMDLSHSFATGPVNGGNGSNVGGLVGYDESGTISNAYATGAVIAGTDANVGGLIGYKIQSVQFAYSTGAVSAGAGSHMGGSMGIDATQDGYNNQDIYWDTDTSGVTNLSQGAGNVSNDSGISGLTTGQLQSGLPVGFDKSIWREKADINGGFPYLLALPPE